MHTPTHAKRYPIHLLFCLVIIPVVIMSLTETALASQQIDASMKSILKRVKDAKSDEASDWIGKLGFITSLANFPNKEIKALKAYLKTNTKDIEQGNSSTLVALSLIRRLVRGRKRR